MFVNKNAGIQNVWTYDPDLNNPAFLNATQRSVNLRLTWQASVKNKLSFFADDQGRCQCRNVTATMSPEAAIEIKYPIQRMMTAAWTSTVSSRLLVEVRGGLRQENYKYSATPAGDPYLKLIMVTEQASVNGAPAGLVYHGGGIGGATFTQPFQNTYGRNIDAMATATYVTGSHSFKAGFADTIVLRNESLSDNDYHVSYRFNNGVPNQITERTTPYSEVAAAAGRHRPVRAGQVDDPQCDPERRSAVRLPEHLHPGAASRPGAARADPQPRSARDRPRELEGSDAASRGGLRRDERRQDGGEGEHQQVRHRPGRAGRLRGRAGAGQPAGQLRHAQLDGRQPQLRAGLRPDEPARPELPADRRGSLFRDVRSELRQAHAERGGRSGGDERLRRPSLQLGVLGGCPAAGRVADVGRVRVLPPLVRQLRGDGQPGARRDRFLAVQRHLAGGSAAARRRRRHHARVPRPEQDRRDQTTTSRRPATTGARFSTGTASI